ncbi:MAG: hypothetical protein ACO1OB_00635 [Archangium sp.]
MRRRCLLSLVLVASVASAAETPTAGALVLPPVGTFAVGKKGPFAGVDTRKAQERFDAAGHKRLVTAFDAKLGGKAIPADVTLGLLDKANVTAKTVDKPESLKKLAEAAKVEWLVTFEFGSKANSLTAQIHDATGNKVGDAIVLPKAQLGLTDAQAREMAELVVPKILVLEKARIDTIAELNRQAELIKPPPPEEFVDTELVQLKKQPEVGTWPDPKRVRAFVAVGPGAAVRDLQLSGNQAGQLADLTNNAIVGLGIAAAIMPLELFDATGGKSWSQLSLEFHYRRAFVEARSNSPGLEGTTCTMNDDDLQLRAGWRYRFGDGDGYAPTIGVAGGWSQENTQFQCALPLVSTTWRGVDAQLRIRQPLYKNLLTLEVVGGPRFILPGPLASNPQFSLSGEAWLELKPVSILFARGGARASWLRASNPELAAVDTRAFFALELGAFF